MKKKWIDASRPPLRKENNQYFLVAIHGKWIEWGTWAKNCAMTPEWKWWDERGNPKAHVTHWMELPDPPEKSQKEAK